jgi:hypothetical protein
MITEHDPNNFGSGHGSDVGYHVQVRCERTCHSRPLTLADGIVTSEWRDVHFQQTDNPAGIPVRAFDQKAYHGLLSFDAALALAWTIIAQHETFGLECRLIAIQLEHTWKLTRQGIVDGLNIKSRLRSEHTLTPVP